MLHLVFRISSFALLIPKRKMLGPRAKSSSLLRFAFCTLPFALLFTALICIGQESPQKPYAAIDHSAITYHGPGRDASHDFTGPEIRLGLLAPLSGPRQAEGEALRQAAEIAIEEENAASFPSGRRLTLVARDASGPWGQASSQVVHLVFDDDALAVITSAQADSAHLAEQVGNKVGVPILTLSSDSTTTEINLPWIFRLGPSDTVQARAFARDIFQARKLQRVVLLTQNDRDGRLGGEAFLKAAEALQAAAPTEIVVDPGKLASGSFAKDLATAQAIVIWADVATARLLSARVREVQAAAPIYLCGKAVDNGERPAALTSHAASSGGGNREQWVAAPQVNEEARADFDRRYRRRFGTEPGEGAAEAYDAVRILAASLRQSGPNRARLRDALDGVSRFPGASGVISFDRAGNDTSQVTLARIR